MLLALSMPSKVLAIGAEDGATTRCPELLHTCRRVQPDQLLELVTTEAPCGISVNVVLGQELADMLGML